MSEISLLQESRLLKHFDEKSFQEVQAFFSPVTFEDGAIIFREGDPADYFAVLTAGNVGICRLDKKSQLQPLWQLDPGMTFGEMALFDGQPRSGTAVAEGEVRLYKMNLADYVQLVDKRPDLALQLSINVAGIIAEYLRNSNLKFYRAVDALQARSRR